MKILDKHFKTFIDTSISSVHNIKSRDLIDEKVKEIKSINVIKDTIEKMIKSRGIARSLYSIKSCLELIYEELKDENLTDLLDMKNEAVENIFKRNEKLSLIVKLRFFIEIKIKEESNEEEE